MCLWEYVYSPIFLKKKIQSFLLTPLSPTCNMMPRVCHPSGNISLMNASLEFTPDFKESFQLILHVKLTVEIGRLTKINLFLFSACVCCF